MNERIRELVEKSYIYDKQNDSSFFNKEKFAELIVREYEDEIWNCVMVESAGSDDKFLIRGIVRSALHDAKQHFGVEE